MRASGILMPIFSLPGRYGCGTLGTEARTFADFLAKAGQHIWQILPAGPTGYGASPYQSDCTFAGNPYFIDPELLCKEGLVSRAECKAAQLDDSAVDWDKLMPIRDKLLHAAADRFLACPPSDWQVFCQQETWWVDDWAMYRVARDQYNGAPYWTWPEPLRRREGEAMGRHWFSNQPQINYYKFLQYIFYRQWESFKQYLNEREIQLMGDLPIYVSPDSADVWTRPHLFCLDGTGRPAKVAGVPPDAFCADGQLWGNPVYNWQAHQQEGYWWWCARIQHALRLYDLLRIDHFRGFESYWAVDAGACSAKDGCWMPGPGMQLFSALQERLGQQLPIVAEDLGILTNQVRQLLAQTGYPGMKVLQFAFDSGPENEYLPHRHIANCVVYTGTHDNTTLADWLHKSNAKTLRHVKEYLCVHSDDDMVDRLIRTALASCADRCIIPMADWLGLGAQGRINTPSTVGKNWCWRAPKSSLNAALARRMRHLTELYGRL
ncbi:MAG: 4-alpha-glucanotransferase [Pygmaiobacter massiliensis]|nr:4-alpha-glucanotransferase [Pygmaiobacter massiliensis]